MPSRAFIHDVNQCLHVIRLAAESLSLEHREGRLEAEKLDKRLRAILTQVDALSALMDQRPPQRHTPDQIFTDNRHQGGDGPTILVVEDEVLAAMMLAEHLHLRGYDVHVAHDGQEALTLCHRTVFDAVITDIRMPRLDGGALIRQLDVLQPGTPIIVASGHIRDSQTEPFPANVIAVVGKPFSPSRISDILASAIPASHHTGD